MKILAPSFSLYSTDPQKIPNDIMYMSRNLNIYGSLCMVLFLLVFGVYLLKHRRYQSFELKILVSMLITYALSPVIYKLAPEESHPSSIHAIQISLKLFYHWVYTSQYIKTCMLLPSIINNMRLLVQSYHMITESQENLNWTKDFMKEHEEIDKAIQSEKKRVRAINKSFQIYDLIVGVSILGFFMTLWYVFRTMNWDNQ